MHWRRHVSFESGICSEQEVSLLELAMRPRPATSCARTFRSYFTFDDRADARNSHQLAATLAAMRQNLDLFGDVLDTLIKTPPIAAEVLHDPDHAR
jgi:hypothetical protein